MTQIRTAAGPQITFHDRNEKVILRNIVALIEQVRAGDFIMGFQISPAMHVLGSLLNIEKIDEEDITRHLILSAGINVQGVENLDIGTFIEALGSTAGNYLQREIKEFHIVFPLNIDPGLLPKVLQLQVGGIKFELATWKVINEQYDIDDLINKIGSDLNSKFLDPWNRRGIPLLVKLQGRNETDVFQRTERTYDLLVSTINYLLDKGITILLQNPEPIGLLRPAVGYGVFSPEGKLMTSFVDLEQLNFQTLCKEKYELDELLRILGLTNGDTKPNSTIEIYFSALLTYNSALLTNKWTNAYLALWQALEWLTFDQSANYDMKSVVERVCILINCGDSIKDFLHLCSKRRNDLVHRGQFSTDGQSEVLILKTIVRESLKQFLRLADSYPNRNYLNEYFIHSKFSREALKEKNEVINKILAVE